MNLAPTPHRLNIQVLTPAQKKTIREGTLHVLSSVGVRFPSPQALAVFEAHGADVERESGVVRIPPHLVRDALKTAPRSFCLGGRVEGATLDLSQPYTHFSTDGCGTETLDFESGIRRPSQKADVAKMARVADYLPTISFYWPMVSAQDYGKLAPLHELDASFNHLRKHVQTETVMGEKMAHYAVRMAEVVAGDDESFHSHPPLSSLICTIAPLGHDREGLEAGMVFAKHGIPVGFMAMPNMGSTAPAVPGGALVVGNAEVISALVLMQLVAPGAPVFHSMLLSAMDPQSAEYLVSTPEKFLANAAAVEIAHDWGVPSLAGSFGVDAKEPDSWQLGRDSVYTPLLSALTAAEFTIGLGMLEASTLLVPEQILFDDEICRSHRIFLQGLPIDGVEDLALDLVEDVGPGGHFLGQKHTQRHLRERWIPDLTHPASTGNGEVDYSIRDRARHRLRKILADHHPPPLSEDQNREFQAIIKAAEDEIGC